MTFETDDIANYDYELPAELIASVPLERRADSRLLLVNRRTDTISHHQFADLPGLLATGDRLVFNDSRVLPARLLGIRAATGGKWEGLFLRELDNGHWRLLGQTRGRLRPGESLHIRSVRFPESEPLELELIERLEEGAWRAKPAVSESAVALLTRYGDVPLPPYIRARREESARPGDFERYQTVYARSPGSVAAPTAGLHFTQEWMETCRRRGLATSYVTLHVGIGTFRPISVRRLDEHVMHAEYGELGGPEATKMSNTRKAGGRIVAVGTTSVRVLETAAREDTIAPFAGETSLFIRSPYRFRAVDALLTNFHLPRSSLLVLVSTFAGHKLIGRAYAEAVRERYRFYSYGDAMLIV